jgi:hypothetical protein
LRASDLLLLAMAHHHAGQKEKAEVRLKQAQTWIRNADASAIAKRHGLPPGSGWSAWSDRPLTLALKREAEQLLRGGSAQRL